MGAPFPTPYSYPAKLSNHNAEAATVMIRFLTSSGEDFEVSLDSSEPAGTFEFELAARGTLTLATSGEGIPRAGWAILQSTQGQGNDGRGDRPTGANRDG